MWKTLKNLKLKQLLSKFQADESFHNAYKKDVLFWSKGSILKNIKNGFHEDIPQDKIIKWLQTQRPKVKGCFPPNQIERYELIGSTSVPGMPGMMSPDICFFTKTFPPSDETVQKLDEIGYKLAGFYNIIDNTYDDLWFLKRYEYDQNIGLDIGANLHIWKNGSKTASKLIGFRDLLRNNKNAFDDYKRKKLQNMDKDVITNDDYSIYKLGKVEVAAEYLQNFRG